MQMFMSFVFVLLFEKDELEILLATLLLVPGD